VACVGLTVALQQIVLPFHKRIFYIYQFIQHAAKPRVQDLFPCSSP